MLIIFRLTFPFQILPQKWFWQKNISKIVSPVLAPLSENRVNLNQMRRFLFKQAIAYSDSLMKAVQYNCQKSIRHVVKNGSALAISHSDPLMKGVGCNCQKSIRYVVKIGSALAISHSDPLMKGVGCNWQKSFRYVVKWKFSDMYVVSRWPGVSGKTGGEGGVYSKRHWTHMDWDCQQKQRQTLELWTGKGVFLQLSCLYSTDIQFLHQSTKLLIAPVSGCTYTHRKYLKK